MALADERHGARGARVHFEDVELVVLDRELDVHQADDLERFGERVGGGADGVEHLGVQGVRGHHHGGVAGVDAGELDVLEHAADDAGLAIADAVHVELDGVFEELVDEHGFVRHYVERLAHDGLEFVLAVDDEHAAAAEHEGRAEEDGEADLLRGLERVGLVHRCAIRGRLQAGGVENGGELFPVFGELDALGRSADYVHAVGLQGGGEIERGLAAELDDDAVAAFPGS